jgi:hypothetical protein
MAEEMTQEPTPESVPVAQEPSGAVTGENQQVQADQSTVPTSESQPEATTQETPEIEEWNGNDVEKLPKPLQARAKGILRYLHQTSQEAAQVKQLAQAYVQLTQHPEFQEYIKWTEQRQSASQQQPQVASEPLSEDDFLAAQTDPNKFVEMQQKLLMQQAAPVLNELNSIKQELAGMKHEKAQEQASRQLDAFASQHPDFWKINPTLMKAVLEEVVQKKGGTVEDAYNYAKNVEKQFLEQAKSTLKQQVDSKKKAVTASPSKSLDPEVIYVNNSREATRVAFENAKLGKRVDVRVKRK